MCLELIYPKKKMVLQKDPCLSERKHGVWAFNTGLFQVFGPKPRKIPLEPGFCPATHVFFSDMETIGTLCYILHYILGLS